MSSALERLFRTYLHQDYDLRYSSVVQALRAFRAESDAAEVRRAIAEIDALLAAHPVDAQLHAQLRERGFIFYPPRDGETTQSWLRRAREQLLRDLEDPEEDRDRDRAERNAGGDLRDGVRSQVDAGPSDERDEHQER